MFLIKAAISLMEGLQKIFHVKYDICDVINVKIFMNLQKRRKVQKLNYRGKFRN